MTAAPGLALAAALAALLCAGEVHAAAAKKGPSAPAAGEAERLAGQKHFEQGRFEEALAPLEKAWELGKKPAVLYTLGQCHRQLGNWEKAAFWFGRYLALAPRPVANEEAARTLLSEMQLKADVEKKQQPQIEVAQPTAPPEPVVPAAALPARPEPVPAPPAEAQAEGGGIHTKWWFWTALGAVVVGGAVTGAVLATQPPGKAPTTLGELQW